MVKIITYNKNGSRKEELKVTNLKESIRIYNEERKNNFPAPTLWKNEKRIIGF